MTRDAYKLLRAELVRAERSAPGTADPRRQPIGARVWRSRRTLVVLGIVGLASAAVATAAVTGTSLPLVGSVPSGSSSGAAPGTLDGQRYEIFVTPSLDPGAQAAGWLAGVEYQSGFGTTSGGAYPTTASEMFQGANVGRFGGSYSGGEHGQQIAFVITGPDVVSVLVEGRALPTFTSASLPVGDRAAVFMVPVNQSSAAGSAPSIVPLDASGHAMPDPLPSTVSEPGSGWHVPQRPQPGACELSSSRADLVAESGRTISSVTPVTDALGQLFTSCLYTQYQLDGHFLDVGILVDARHPGQTLTPIPGANPINADGTVVNNDTARLSARRVGNAWLVVEDAELAIGSAQESRKLRLAALNALSISRFHMPGAS